MKFYDFDGLARQSTPGEKKTAGLFVRLMETNAAVFRHYFGDDLTPGSFNITLPEAPDIHLTLDKGEILPCFTIPWAEILGPLNPPRLGDGQAWRCQLSGGKIPSPHDCWVFRRIKSTVPAGVIEVLSPVHLVKEYGFENGDPLKVRIFNNGAPPSSGSPPQ